MPDAPGAWRIKVVDDTGHGLDATIEVGAPASAAAPQAAPGAAAFALRPVLGALVIAVVFGGLFLAYRRKAAKP